MSAIYVRIKRIVSLYAWASLDTPIRYGTPIWSAFLLFLALSESICLQACLAQSAKKLISIYKKLIHFNLVTPNTVVL